MTIFWRRRCGALACAGLVLALSACSSSDHGSGTQAGSAAPPTTRPSTSPTSSPGAPSTSDSAPSTTKAGPPTCRAAELRISYADDAGGGAAGSVYGHLVLTNTSASSCSMTGWPGVSYVGGGNGTQLGAPADRTGRAGVIVLPAGGAAEARLREVEAGNVAGSCSPTRADGLRVYAPNSTAAVFVKHPAEACRSTAVHLLTIEPVVRS